MFCIYIKKADHVRMHIIILYTIFYIELEYCDKYK